MVDALSFMVFAIGVGPSWMLMDGLFAQLAIFDRTQPEGLALATCVSPSQTNHERNKRTNERT